MNSDSALILYLSYNSIEEPLVESQVLSYLRALSKLRYRFHLVTFERRSWTNTEVAAQKRTLESLGIEWRPVVYRSNPVSFLLASWQVFWLCRCRRYQLIHARSFVPSAIARLAKRIFKHRFINDIRGFWVDEKVYKGTLGQNTWLYQMGKTLEQWIYSGSDSIISLTNAAKKEITEFDYLTSNCPPITVIPTCVDLDKFALKERSTPRKKLVVGYVGSLSDVYLPQQIFDVYEHIRQSIPDSELKIITRTDSQLLQELVSQCEAKGGLVSLRSAPHHEVAKCIAEFDIALCFIKPGYAKIASSATKIGEYLAVGVPVICNSGIGDTDEIFGSGDVGVVLNSFCSGEYQHVVNFINSDSFHDNSLTTRCRDKAIDWFSLDAGVALYQQTYQNLLKIRQ